MATISFQGAGMPYFGHVGLHVNWQHRQWASKG